MTTHQSNCMWRQKLNGTYYVKIRQLKSNRLFHQTIGYLKIVWIQKSIIAIRMHRTMMSDGCRKWKLLHRVDRIVVCGWDLSSFSKRTTHRAGKIFEKKTNVFFLCDFERNFLFCGTSDHFSSSPLQHIDSEAVEIGVNAPANRPARSNPMPMPPIALGRGIVPVLIESGSASMIFFPLSILFL